MPEVFVPTVEVSKPGLNIGLIMGKSPTKGEVGIEIEVEGKKLIHEEETPDPWKYYVDGSLRGQENAEYILKKPIAFSDVDKVLDKLWAAFKKKKSVLDDSNRTSVHVHLNCQDFHLNRLTAFLASYFALEEILTEWCGEYRVGNLFCLRAIDAPAIVLWAKRFIRSDGNKPLPDTLHYSGLNVNALKKYGSLEIRTLRGTSNPTVIKQWVAVLHRLYDISADFSDPREICTMVSTGGGPLVFFDTILGDTASIIRNGISFTDQEIRDSIYTGIRLAQDICYCRDWSLYHPLPLKPDPFSRNMKKVAQKIMNAQAESSLPQEVNGIAGIYQTGTYLTNTITNGEILTVSISEEEPDEYLDDSIQEYNEWETE